jgi:hypothetical protein
LFCCRFNRQKRYGNYDWGDIHRDFILIWIHRERVVFHSGDPHDQYTFDEYLRWFHKNARTHIRPPYTSEIEVDSDEEVIADVYDEDTRLETQPHRAPLQRYVVRLSNPFN